MAIDAVDNTADGKLVLDKLRMALKSKLVKKKTIAENITMTGEGRNAICSLTQPIGKTTAEPAGMTN